MVKEHGPPTGPGRKGTRRMNTLTMFLLYNVLLVPLTARCHWKPNGKKLIFVAHGSSVSWGTGHGEMDEEAERILAEI